MRTLEFEVNGQRLTKKKDCDFSGIVAGTSGYLKAKFNFATDDWDGCKKAASFFVRNYDSLEYEEYAVLLDEDTTCLIPEEALKMREIYVSLIGVKENYKITTTKAVFSQEVE